jgi:hypothetical protein
MNLATGIYTQLMDGKTIGFEQLHELTSMLMFSLCRAAPIRHFSVGVM